MTKKSGLLQIPQGAEGFYLEEAFRHRKITKHIEKVFTTWGYLPVETPVFDFFDTYSHLLDKKRAEQTYRLIDREGELLMLRSDITLFLAKQMSLALDQKDLPVRVFYADTILRYESHEDISSNEFFQSGCELIGKPGKETDLESILLLYNLFKDIKLDSVKIHLGSRAIFNSLCLDLEEKDISFMYQALDRRDENEIYDFLLEKGHSKEESRASVSLLMFIGNTIDFEIFLKTNVNHLNEVTIKEIQYLLEISSSIDILEKSQCFRIDISEIGGQDYYTGIVFSAYLEGLSTAAATGGRYDSLFNKFGYNASSVGFSILQRKIEPLLKESERYAPPEYWSKTENETFFEAYQRGEKIKAQGKTFVL